MSQVVEQAIDELIGLLETIEAPDFVPASWPDRGSVEKDGVKVYNMPYPDYHPVVERMRWLFATVADGIDPYGPLPEDPTQDGIPFSVMGADFPIEYFQTATYDQLRRYFMLCLRGERFCDGHIESQFTSGSVAAALRRLAKLKRSTA